MLTKLDVDGFKFDPNGKAQQIRFDAAGKGTGNGAVPGFGVRAYPSGAKSYVVRYRNRSGRTRLLTIGSTSVLTLKQAREQAREQAVAVAGGKDPLEERKRARASLISLSDYADEWLEGYAKSHRRSWREDRRRIDRHLKGTPLGRRALASVTGAHIGAIHDKIGASAPVEANRVIQLVRLIYNTAIARGVLPEGHRNPARVVRSTYGGAAAAVRTYRERPRKVFVREDEMKGLLDAIDVEPLAAVFHLVLLTASRKSEILTARWEGVNLRRGELMLGGTGLGQWRGAAKEGGRTVYLSDRAVEIIRGIEKRGSPFLFPAPSDTRKPLDTRSRPIKAAWTRIREAANLEHITLHDMRHTCGSWLLRAGWTELQIAEALGHESGGGTTRRYAHITPEQARDMLNDFARLIEETRNPAPPRACPSCEATGHDPGAEFCASCGSSLGDS